jgi:ParB family chromosome partitioning protein
VSANPKGLGKGFDVLIPTNFDESILLDSKDRVQKLFISDIETNPEQPRRHFDETSLNELAASIKRYGILQPLIVSPGSDNKYQLVAGERRLRAAEKAGLKQVPAIVRKREELEQLEVALIENVQRVDLSPLEQAISIERLHQQFNISYKMIAERLGKALPTIHNTARLLQLPEDARAALRDQKITEGHARAILALKDDHSAQTDLLTHIIRSHWSVRQAEQFVTSYKLDSKNIQPAKSIVATESPETKKLAKSLSAKVTLRKTAKGGRLEIHYKDDQDLKRLLRKLAG